MAASTDQWCLSKCMYVCLPVCLCMSVSLSACGFSVVYVNIVIRLFYTYTVTNNVFLFSVHKYVLVSKLKYIVHVSLACLNSFAAAVDTMCHVPDICGYLWLKDVVTLQ